MEKWKMKKEKIPAKKYQGLDRYQCYVDHISRNKDAFTEVNGNLVGEGSKRI